MTDCTLPNLIYVFIACIPLLFVLGPLTAPEDSVPSLLAPYISCCRICFHGSGAHSHSKLDGLIVNHPTWRLHFAIPMESSESPARLNLRRLYEQTHRGAPSQDGAKPAGTLAPPPPTTKGRPRLLLMGQSRYEIAPHFRVQFLMFILRSGKSSISSVVFQKLPPNETLFLESTPRIQKDQMA